MCCEINASYPARLSSLAADWCLVESCYVGGGELFSQAFSVIPIEITPCRFRLGGNLTKTYFTNKEIFPVCASVFREARYTVPCPDCDSVLVVV